MTITNSPNDHMTDWSKGETLDDLPRIHTPLGAVAQALIAQPQGADVALMVVIECSRSASTTESRATALHELGQLLVEAALGLDPHSVDHMFHELIAFK